MRHLRSKTALRLLVVVPGWIRQGVRFEYKATPGGDFPPSAATVRCEIRSIRNVGPIAVGDRDPELARMGDRGAVYPGSNGLHRESIGSLEDRRLPRDRRGGQPSELKTCTKTANRARGDQPVQQASHAVLLRTLGVPRSADAAFAARVYVGETRYCFTAPDVSPDTRNGSSSRNSMNIGASDTTPAGHQRRPVDQVLADERLHARRSPSTASASLTSVRANTNSLHATIAR